MNIRVYVAIMILLLTTALAWGQADRPDSDPMPTPAQLGQTWVELDGEAYGAVPDSLGPIGGGEGYAYIITGGDYTVGTPEELMAALAVAQPGEIIYLKPTGDFDFTTLLYVTPNLRLNIPEGVTVASNRGHNGSRGAIVCSTQFRTSPLFQAVGPNVRLAGLWLRGPEPNRRLEHHARAFGGTDPPGSSYYYLFPTSDGIRTSEDGLQVDNCEISGWSHGGVYLAGGVDHHIHHSFIHHNQYNGLGYGIVHGPSESLIEYNVFNANRHSIAGSGVPGSGYWARHNVELGVSLSHCFDMHGGRDRGDGTDIAGTWMKMDHNMFRSTQRAIAIRGVPEWQAEITKNWFSHTGPSGSVVMPYPVGGDTQVLMWDNAYGFANPRVRAESVAEPGSPPPLYSSVRLTDENWDDKDIFEETDRVYIEVNDRDEVGWGTITATMFAYSDDAASVVTDRETVVLDETGSATGVYRGSIQLRGRVGANEDGALNIIAGQFGRPIGLHYVSQDHVTDPTFPGPAIEEHLLIAQVIDTRAPSPINQPSAMQPTTELIAASGAHGRSVDLDWTAYDEDIEVDIVGYRVYLSDTAFSATDAGAQLYGVVPAGRQTTSVSGLEPDNTYYFAVVAFDEVPNPAVDASTPVNAVEATTADTAPPQIINAVPIDGATQLALDTSIGFRVTDEGVGIDVDAADSVQVQVIASGNLVPIDITITEHPTFWQVEAQPEQPFEWNAQVEVEVRVADRAGNQAVEAWAFSVATDNVAPQVTQLSPADGATSVSGSSPVSFHLTDNKSGVDISIVDGVIDPSASQLTVTFDGQDITDSIAATEVNGKLDVACSYSPSGGIAYNSSHTVSVVVQDAAGNSSEAVEWSFDMAMDTTPPTIGQQNPAPDQTDVALDTGIEVHISDNQSGVFADSIRMWVDGTEVSDALSRTRKGASVLVNYAPPEPFALSQAVAVRIYAEDRVGNVADITYGFTAVSAETFVIAGSVMAADGTPVPGVSIAVGGRAVLTDGNGSYQVLGLESGSYTVTPSRALWTFEPISRQITLGPDDATNVNFIGTPVTFQVSGRVVDRDGAGAGDVTITWDTGSVQTDADGRYSIDNLRPGHYTFTPALPYGHFDPINRVVEVSDADVTGVNFTTIPDTFSISGTVLDGRGQPIQGVEVRYSGGSAVTNGTGRYTLSNVPIGTHTLSASRIGYQVVPASLQVQVPPDYSGADFTGYAAMSNTFPAGVSMVAVPGTPATVADTDMNDNPVNVFSTDKVVRWDPSATPPAYRRGPEWGSSDLMRVRPGSGYFVRYSSVTNLAIGGQPTDPTRAISIPLAVGWNMIGNPFANPTSLANFQTSITEAVRPYAFVYNNATGSYELVSSRPAIHAARDSLQPWEGAWILCMTAGSSLNVTASAATAAVAKPESVPVGGGYLVPVVATAAGRSDTSSVAGAIPGAGAEHTLPNPPTAPDTVDLYFVGSSGELLARDIRNDANGAQSFDFVVSCAVGPTDVSVALPDLSAVPAQYEVILTDVAANRSVYVRTSPSYTYRTAETESLRRFRLEVRPRTTASLAVTPASAVQQGDNSVLSYSVSQSCKVDISVRNIAGIPIRTLTSDQPVGPGLQTLSWNLRNDAGARVPAGSYLVEIRAMGEDGQQARAIARVQLAR